MDTYALSLSLSLSHRVFSISLARLIAPRPIRNAISIDPWETRTRRRKIRPSNAQKSLLRLSSRADYLKSFSPFETEFSRVAQVDFEQRERGKNESFLRQV